eukprot:PhF_6_TR25107/c0_g1_i1/m.34508
MQLPGYIPELRDVGGTRCVDVIVYCYAHSHVNVYIYKTWYEAADEAWKRGGCVFTQYEGPQSLCASRGLFTFAVQQQPRAVHVKHYKSELQHQPHDGVPSWW